MACIYCKLKEEALNQKVKLLSHYKKANAKLNRENQELNHNLDLNKKQIEKLKKSFKQLDKDFTKKVEEYSKKKIKELNIMIDHYKNQCEIITAAYNRLHFQYVDVRTKYRKLYHKKIKPQLNELSIIKKDNNESDYDIGDTFELLLQDMKENTKNCFNAYLDKNRINIKQVKNQELKDVITVNEFEEDRESIDGIEIPDECNEGSNSVGHIDPKYLTINKMKFANIKSDDANDRNNRINHEEEAEKQLQKDNTEIIFKMLNKDNNNIKNNNNQVRSDRKIENKKDKNSNASNVVRNVLIKSTKNEQPKGKRTRYIKLFNEFNEKEVKNNVNKGQFQHPKILISDSFDDLINGQSID